MLGSGHADPLPWLFSPAPPQPTLLLAPDNVLCLLLLVQLPLVVAFPARPLVEPPSLGEPHPSTQHQAFVRVAWRNLLRGFLSARMRVSVPAAGVFAPRAASPRSPLPLFVEAAPHAALPPSAVGSVVPPLSVPLLLLPPQAVPFSELRLLPAFPLLPPPSLLLLLFGVSVASRRLPHATLRSLLRLGDWPTQPLPGHVAVQLPPPPWP
mmetsp:Transcript_59737/g.131153  ORF Transcript_59737/g.131153 Transcript_59737/m.131153 type:complete len:209 (+) Transcript_59737:619-1245(+)